jgi:hypothetical protein
MEKKKVNLRFGMICLLILLAALSRLIPHPANFAPVGGMALFGAAYFGRRLWAVVIPVAAMWLSDLALNNIVYSRYFDRFVWFYDGSLFTYASFAAIALLGMLTLKKVRPARVLLSALSASAIFYLVSNFGVWYSSGMYPPTLAGLEACYVAGLPFLKNTLAGDLFYTATLFGAFESAARLFPHWQLQELHAKTPQP